MMQRPPRTMLSRAEAEWPRAVVVTLAVAIAPIAFAAGTMLARGGPAVLEQTRQWLPIVLFDLPLAIVVGVATTIAPPFAVRRLIAIAVVCELALFAIGALLGPTTIPHHRRVRAAPGPRDHASRAGAPPVLGGERAGARLSASGTTPNRVVRSLTNPRGNRYGSHHVVSA